MNLVQFPMKFVAIFFILPLLLMQKYNRTLESINILMHFKIYMKVIEKIDL